MDTRRLGRGLDALFLPQSIALVGASTDARKTGGRPIKLLKQHGYAGKVYPINPRVDVVQGVPAYAEVDALPETPDLVLLAVSGEPVMEALQACARRGVQAAVVMSSGFTEAGEQGAALQARITALAKSSGMRVVGPNCLGAVSVPQRAIATFSVALEEEFPPLGRTAVVSQSGNIGSVIMKALTTAGVGISRFIATGNECDVDVADALAWMSADSATDTVLCCVESVRDGASWLQAVRQLRANGKRVFVMKIGTSAAGQVAAMTHTGGLVGSDAVFDAAIESTGATRVNSLEALVQLGVASEAVRAPLDIQDRSVVVVAASGGFGIMMADAASEHGFVLNPPSEKAQHRIKQSLPLASVQNPVDATAQMSANPEALYELLAALLEDESNQLVCVTLALAMEVPRLRDIYMQTFERLTNEFPTRQLLACVNGPADAVKTLTQMGVLCFPSIDASFIGLRSLFEASRAVDPFELSDHGPKRQAISEDAYKHEQAAKRALNGAGVPVLPEWCVSSAEQAHEVAQACGRPMAMKVMSAHIAHKTEVGGVALNVSPEDAARVYEDIMVRVRRAMPDAKVEGILMSPMAEGGFELIVGSTTDPAFGPTIMVGMGGIYAEVFRDTALRLAPVTDMQALEMLKSLQCFPLLDGYRGQPRLDTAAAASAIAAISRFVHAHQDQLNSIDVNPLLVKEQGVWALDALLTPHPTAMAQAQCGEQS